MMMNLCLTKLEWWCENNRNFNNPRKYKNGEEEFVVELAYGWNTQWDDVMGMCCVLEGKYLCMHSEHTEQQT